ncbi:MAG: MOSC domain-containing protein [Alteromonadaceae bacterium]|nr:MOSC domain-containing protein [Alteromonadaceae bacterium]
MSTINLAQINIYPIKSSAGIQLSSSWVDEYGLSFDRRFVVTDNRGQFITARTEPTLCLVQANITATGLKLTAPNMPVLSIDYRTFGQSYQNVSVWKDTISAQHCQASYDLWFSEYLNKPCQLLFFGDGSKRLVKDKTSQVAFADAYPLLLISESSLADLNQRSSISIEMSRFRPNVVASGCQAFAEDTWKHIRIGEVEFEVTNPCSRCILTTVDPLTGQKDPGLEPLASLKTYRKVASGDVMFGQNLVPLNQGQIKANDPIVVLDRKEPPFFVSKKVVQKKVIDNAAIKDSAHPADILLQTNVRQTNLLSNKLVKYPEQFTLQCQKIIIETLDVKTFIFKNELPNTFAQQTGINKITYLAGQHLPIILKINGKNVSGVYTLSSSPTRPEMLSITVKRIPDGRVSVYLHDHFKVGDVLQAKPPAGNFHQPQSNESNKPNKSNESTNSSKVLLLSAGSGITPMLAMLKAMSDQAIDNNLTFFHSAKSEQDIIALDEVSALAKQHGNCQILYTLTRGASPQWQDYQGHLSGRMLKNIPDLVQREVYVCGPAGFRNSAKQLLLALGLPEEQYHFESFGYRKSPDTLNKSVDESEDSNATVTQAIPNKKVSISFKSWGKDHQGNNQDYLLEQGENAGLILNYSCRAGMCGSCKVKLISGQVIQLDDDGLSDCEKKEGYILACSAIPQTDVVISKD